MAESANLTLIRRQYANVGNRAVAEQLMSSDVVWDITPGFPLGGIYTGLDSVLDDFLAALGGQVAGLSAQPQEFFEDSDGHVIVLGYYGVQSHSGHHTEARFVHIWTIRDNRITRLQQVADSHLVHQTLLGQQR